MFAITSVARVPAALVPAPGVRWQDRLLLTYARSFEHPGKVRVFHWLSQALANGRNCAELHQNVRMNRFQNVVIEQIAASAQSSLVQLIQRMKGNSGTVAVQDNIWARAI